MPVEIEARFLNVDVPALLGRLHDLGADDLGEDLLRETIFYDKELTWQASGRVLVRIREGKNGVAVSYKNAATDTASGTEEIEFAVDDAIAAEGLLIKIGLVAFRRQEKKRHSFLLKGVRVDIDTWPGVPPYVEIEGPSEAAIREATAALGLDWPQAIFGNAGLTIETHYGIPVRQLRWFTFDRIE